MADEATTTGRRTLEDLLLEERWHSYPDMTVLGAVERQGNCVDGGWRQMVEDTVLHCYDRTPAHLGREERLEALEARLQASPAADEDAVIELSNERVHHYVDAVTFGALLGYCLGRTTGAGAEALDDWLGRALALADFDPDHRIVPMDEVWRRRLGAAG